jgi:multidrug efflux pump subunit AcrA (membrane-fusion protein)
MNKTLRTTDYYSHQIFTICVIFLLIFVITSCRKSTVENETYICPMHPTVISDKPGVCPVCNMDLVKKSQHGEEVKITEDLARLIKSPNELIVSSVKTIKGEYKSMPFIKQVQGRTTYDSRSTYSISSRVGGRLEKVFLKYNFQPVKKGQRVAEIYSPELMTAQRDFIYLLENDANNSILIAGAKKKLLFAGFTENQVNLLASQRRINHTFPVVSPYDGYLIAGNEDVATTSPDNKQMSGGMSSSATSVTPNATTSLTREGNYVNSGETLFRIVNTSALRIEISLPASDTELIKSGDSIELDIGNGISQIATVDFVQPFFENGEKFLKIRVYSKNLSGMRIGQLVSATITVSGKETLWLPREAVLDLGEEQIVFIKEHGTFKAKKITTGIAASGWIEIKKGLASSDEVAGHAHYLVDSESFVKPAN